ncbi:MAG: ACT domain-containing protein, partial [Omnitrophica bacterium]|nr:ACT domain-containing protein [Candidatus Omnitrophota bacterium]
EAALFAFAGKGTAAIASEVAAEKYGLNILARSIEDSPHNVTRFLIIGKQEGESTKNDKTSIMFSIRDKVGALHDMLIPFKKCRINLTKIESRPSRLRAWEYYFFVDIQGHYKDKKVKKALSELEKKCSYLKVLGSYPVGK